MSIFIISNRWNRIRSSGISQSYSSEIKRRNSRNGKSNLQQKKRKNVRYLNKIQSNDRNNVEKVRITSKAMDVAKLATPNLNLFVTD